MTDRSAELTWNVFVTLPLLTLVDEPPPGEPYRIWPPISSTLISSEDDAVLVDAPITVAQASDLADRVAATGKNLTTIYVTHGHGDHWFGLSVILARFPDAARRGHPRRGRSDAPTQHAGSPGTLECTGARIKSRITSCLPKNSQTV